jgi:prepilin-type N-terminal cleavage/methylation domain-containing protein
MTMPQPRREHGFTLIELMIVVVIVGVLSLLAVIGYKKWVSSSRLSEAYDMVNAIRSAEESFKAENGTYYDVSAGLAAGNTYPAAHPGPFKTGWGATCTNCWTPTSGTTMHTWAALTVEPKGPVMFGYAVITDALGAAPSLTVNGTAVNVSTLTAPWYIVSAVGDTDGNGVYVTVYGFSSTNQLMVNNEGE